MTVTTTTVQRIADALPSSVVAFLCVCQHWLRLIFLLDEVLLLGFWIRSWPLARAAFRMWIYQIYRRGDDSAQKVDLPNLPPMGCPGGILGKRTWAV